MNEQDHASIPVDAWCSECGGSSASRPPVTIAVAGRVFGHQVYVCVDCAARVEHHAKLLAQLPDDEALAGWGRECVRDHGSVPDAPGTPTLLSPHLVDVPFNDSITETPRWEQRARRILRVDWTVINGFRLGDIQKETRRLRLISWLRRYLG